MRTSIEIDDQLLAEAMKLSGARTKRELVDEGLRLLVRLNKEEQVSRAAAKSGRPSRSRSARGAP